MSGWVECGLCGQETEPVDAGRGRLSCPYCGEVVVVVDGGAGGEDE